MQSILLNEKTLFCLLLLFLSVWITNFTSVSYRYNAYLHLSSSLMIISFGEINLVLEHRPFDFRGRGRTKFRPWFLWKKSGQHLKWKNRTIPKFFIILCKVTNSRFQIKFIYNLYNEITSRNSQLHIKFYFPTNNFL